MMPPGARLPPPGARLPPPGARLPPPGARLPPPGQPRPIGQPLPVRPPPSGLMTAAAFRMALPSPRPSSSSTGPPSIPTMSGTEHLTVLFYYYLDTLKLKCVSGVDNLIFVVFKHGPNHLNICKRIFAQLHCESDCQSNLLPMRFFIMLCFFAKFFLQRGSNI